MPRKPTRKQKRAVKILSENVGMSVGTAMRQAGYSEGTALNPDHLTDSKGFTELMEEYLPDDKLAQVHAEGLSAVKVFRDKFGDRYEDPDYYVRHNYLETAYKIKGRMNPKSEEDTRPITVNLIMYDQNKNSPRKIEAIQQNLPSKTSRVKSEMESGMDKEKSG